MAGASPGTDGEPEILSVPQDLLCASEGQWLWGECPELCSTLCWALLWGRRDWAALLAGDGAVEVGRAAEELDWAVKCLLNTSVKLVLHEHAG